MVLMATSRVATFALLLCILLTTPTYVRAERLPIMTYTTAEGLARNRVSRIVKDSRGFMWFCTTEGLSRFDGCSFTNYTTDQGLPGSAVTDLLETREILKEE
jgi:ligand-binding sensor domain-containing protein